jgi:hypothetical protein
MDMEKWHDQERAIHRRQVVCYRDVLGCSTKVLVAQGYLLDISFLNSSMKLVDSLLWASRLCH